MSILVQVLLTSLVLSACLTPRVHTRRNIMLRESISLLGQIQQKEVSCSQMNVTNIFADYEGQNNTEIFCKAARIAQQVVENCDSRLKDVYRNMLKGIYDNLLKMVQQRGAGNEGPCPVAAGSTTSLKNFLKELHQVLQNEYKYQK